jgi:predicted Zn-dependent protease
MFVSENREIEMGKELYPNALWGDLGGGGEYKDEKLKPYLEKIVFGINQVSHRPHLPVSFAIQNSSVPNAWAIPGYVVITRGLLASLDNEAEFTFVMGHEMGHVAARHSASQMTYGILQQIGLGIIGIALSGEKYAGLAVGIGAIGSSLFLLKYSRDDELEADGLGILYMAKLGYDPQNAISAHKNLEHASQEYMRSIGKNPSERGFFEDILSTHPRTSVRIDEIQHMIDDNRPFSIIGDGTYREKFQNMTADLKNTNEVYRNFYDKALYAYQKNNLSEAENLISQALDLDQHQPAFHSLKGFILMKKKEYALARISFDKAIQLERDHEPSVRGIGILMFYQKNYSESTLYLKKAISLFPQDVQANYFLGMINYEEKNYKEAIPHLALFAQVQSDHDEIHGILGICYEKTGDLRLAYNEYSKQVRVAPKNDMGKYAAQRISAIKPQLEPEKKPEKKNKKK